MDRSRPETRSKVAGALPCAELSANSWLAKHPGKPRHSAHDAALSSNMRSTRRTRCQKPRGLWAKKAFSGLFCPNLSWGHHKLP
ncbi:MAG: hypothetical protein JWP89_5851 [Schlesneria sp.]|nr:hypothetical protein [Schlesneria sp.]